jgi:hypothetical protein
MPASKYLGGVLRRAFFLLAIEITEVTEKDDESFMTFAASVANAFFRLGPGRIIVR